MVKSGLINQPDVSHYRLALHLTTALVETTPVLEKLGKLAPTDTDQEIPKA